MAGKSNIEWTQQTWNPLAGCSIVSPGCTNCYAMRMAARIEAMNTEARFSGRSGNAPHYDGTTKRVNGNWVWTGKVNVASDKTFFAPMRRRVPTMYFVNSMSDLFHESVPDEVIDRIFAVMALCPQHTFQVLTKRAERMRDYFSPKGCVNCGDGQLDGKCCDEPCVLDDESGPAFRDAMIEGAAQKIFSQLHPGMGEPSEWLAVHMPLPNVWLGVSTERQQEADERIPLLLQTPAAVRFISAEPLLGPIDLTEVKFDFMPGYFGDALSPHHVPYCNRQHRYPKLDWVIVGGESGPGYRDMDPQWADDIGQQCAATDVPFFLKQMAGKKPIPPSMQCRQMPQVGA